MKVLAPFLIVVQLLCNTEVNAQCTYNCSSYNTCPVPFLLYPADGNTLTLNDDDMSAAIPIGFIFQYYCTYYNQARVCSNGFMTFDIFSTINTATTPYAQAMPDPKATNDVIACNWNDLDPSAGGVVTYTTLGTSPNCIFVLTYSDVPLWNLPGTSNTGQIVLHETTNIIEIYTLRAENNGWLTHTQGIENMNGTSGIAAPGRNLSLWTVMPASPSGVMFAPYTALPPTSVSGPTLLCGGSPGSYSVTSPANSVGNTWTFPPAWSAPGSSSVVTAAAGVSGQVSVTANYSCGSSPPVTLSVTVLPSPTVSIVQYSPQVICSGQTVEFIVAGAPVLTLEPVSASAADTIRISPPATSVYTLFGQGANGCISVNNPTAEVIVNITPTVTVNSGGICNGASFTINASGADTYTYDPPFTVFIPPPGSYVYTITGSSAEGCTATALSHLTVYAFPQVTVAPVRKIMCRGETNTLIATGALNYTWMNGPSSPSFAVSPSVTTTYSVSAEDAHACPGSTYYIVSVSSCNDLEERPADQLSVFPNPADDRISVVANGCWEGFLYMNDGRMFHRFSFCENHDLNIQAMPPGAYLLVVTQGGARHRKKLLKR